MLESGAMKGFYLLECYVTLEHRFPQKAQASILKAGEAGFWRIMWLLPATTSLQKTSLKGEEHGPAEL
jgi:hypothetical protein